MAKLKRYRINDLVENQFGNDVMIGFDWGEWVKYDDTQNVPCRCDIHRFGGMKWWNSGAIYCGDCGGSKPESVA